MWKAGPRCPPLVSIQGKGMAYSGEGAGGPGTQGQRTDVEGRAGWAEKVAACLWNIPAQERQAGSPGHSADRPLNEATACSCSALISTVNVVWTGGRGQGLRQHLP